MTAHAQPPLVAHVVYALRAGGLENGVVNLINRTPRARYRHAVVCLKDYDRFAERIEDDDVEIYALDKRDGQDPGLHLRLWRLFRALRPAIVHTRNIATLEAQIPAWLAGVPGRVHGEHGRDMVDLTGRNRRYRLLRRLHRPLVHRWIAVSCELEAYLRDAAGVPGERVTRIVNGVDLQRFHPERHQQAHEKDQASEAIAARLRVERGWSPETRIIGWVGRMEPVKNPLGLVTAFAELLERHPGRRADTVLALVGEGSQLEEVAGAVADAGLCANVWLAGRRDDVSALMRAFSVFALPSLAEGVSNTVLEALASGVPVIATDVGDNARLVPPEDGCGRIVPVGDASAMAAALATLLDASNDLGAMGAAARRTAEARYGIDAMVAAYLDVYDHLSARSGRLDRHGLRQSRVN